MKLSSEREKVMKKDKTCSNCYWNDGQDCRCPIVRYNENYDFTCPDWKPKGGK